MKVFQIFDKPAPPCEPYIGYMEKIRDMAESYTLIAPQNFMGHRARFVSIGSVWASLPEHLRESPAGQWARFDALRARYLSQHFDHVYLDIDVELHAPIPLLDKPQKAGPGILVGNGDPEMGRAAWAAYLKMCPHFFRHANHMFSGIPHGEVPKEYFTHHYAKGAYA